MDMTYVAQRPVRVRGQRRDIGALVPEARDWPRLRAYLNSGKLAAVPVEMVDKDELAKAEKAYQDAVKKKKKEDAARAEPKPEPQTETDDSDIEEYHVGSGWYEVPGSDKKMRRDDALEFLTAPEEPEKE